MKKNHPGVWLVLLFGGLTLSAAGLLVRAQDDQRSRRELRQQFRATPGEPEPSTGELTAGDSLRVVTVGDRERRYLVHVPRGYNSDEPTPVIIAFHGGGGNPQSMVRLSGLNEKSEQSGFVVAYPYGSGRDPSRSLTFNGGDCCGYAMRKEIDEVAFTRALLDDLAKAICLDQRRVYATGISNGAIVTYYIAANLSDRIAAIAPVAGPMMTESCDPDRPVPVMHFHGTGDKLAPFKGGKGEGTNLVPAFLRPSFRSVDFTMRNWVEANGCKPQPQVQRLPDQADDDMRVTRKVWSGGKDDSEVILYEIENGGHTWPGRDPISDILGPSTKDISANDLMWEFFERHPKPVAASLARPKKGSMPAAEPVPEPGDPKPSDNGDASTDASGTGQLFESIHVPGLTDFREGTNGIVFADFDGNGFLDALTVTTPPFVLSEELKGRQETRDTLRLLLNHSGFDMRPQPITLKGSPATPEDFGQGWRGSQIPVVADFNDDGLLDFFVSRQFPGVSDRVRSGQTPVGNSLFLADGNFHTFTDVSRQMNVLNERAYNRQASLGDVNRDGYIDIAVGADNTTSAFEGIPKAALMVYEPGDGDFASGRYRDLGGSDLVPDFGGFFNDPARDKAGPKVTLRDIDNDGDLDLFQSTHVLINVGYDARRLPFSPALYRQGVFTWRNMLVETGDFRFEKSLGNGLADEARLTYDKRKRRYVPAGENVAPGLAYLFFGDVNNDGLFDVVAVDGTDSLFTPKSEDVAGRFWYNRGGFRFTEATRGAGLSSLNNTYGEWYRFFDNRIPRRLKVPLPRGRMNESQPGLPDKMAIDFRPYHGDLVFADFDNDTHLDFVVIDRREAKLLEPRAILYMNLGDGTFEPKPTTFSGIDSSGIAGEAVDLNNDGLVDLFISGDPDNTAPDGNLDHRYEDKVFLNTGAHGGRDNHWLRLRFDGISHARLLGTRIEIFRTGTDVRIGTRGVYADHAYKTGSPLEAHFGLGLNESVDVKVLPPTGESFTLPAVKGDRYLELNVEDRRLHRVSFRTAASEI